MASKSARPRVPCERAFGVCRFWENRSFWESYQRPVTSAQRSGGRNKAESGKQKAESRKQKAESRSLDPGEAHGAHKSRCATRRARIRRGRENRVAPLPSTPLRAGWMTIREGARAARPRENGGRKRRAGIPERGKSVPHLRRWSYIRFVPKAHALG